MARFKKKIFIWIPRVETMYQSVWINNEDVTSSIINASCTRAINTEFGDFNITLANPNGLYSESFTGNEPVEFNIDELDGSTIKFKGYINNYSWSKCAERVEAVLKKT